MYITYYSWKSGQKEGPSQRREEEYDNLVMRNPPLAQLVCARAGGGLISHRGQRGCLRLNPLRLSVFEVFH